MSKLIVKNQKGLAIRSTNDRHLSKREVRKITVTQKEWEVGGMRGKRYRCPGRGKQPKEAYNTDPRMRGEEIAGGN